MITNPNRNLVSSETGSAIKQLFVPRLELDGSIVLEDGGTMNLQDVIQNMAEYCDIELLMQRFEAGDVDALSLRQGVYGDVSAFPSNYREYIDSLREAESFYASLDNKEQFADFSDFVRKVNDAEFLKNLKDINELTCEVDVVSENGGVDIEKE